LEQIGEDKKNHAGWIMGLSPALVQLVKATND
jgi:hypothetical protein